MDLAFLSHQGVPVCPCGPAGNWQLKTRLGPLLDFAFCVWDCFFFFSLLFNDHVKKTLSYQQNWAVPSPPPPDKHFLLRYFLF